MFTKLQEDLQKWGLLVVVLRLVNTLVVQITFKSKIVLNLSLSIFAQMIWICSPVCMQFLAWLINKSGVI